MSACPSTASRQRLRLAFSVLITCATLAPALASTAGRQHALIGDNVRIAGTLDGGVYSEPHIAVDPADPRNLIVAAMSQPQGVDQYDVEVWTSADTGESWRRASFPRPPVEVVLRADPWLAFGRDGRAYLVHIALVEGEQGSELQGRVHRSDDGGRTWGTATIMPFGPGSNSIDKTSMVVDVRGGREVIYVIGVETWSSDSGQQMSSVFISLSEDSGRTFSAPHRLTPTALVRNVGHPPVVLGDGSVVVPFMDFAVRRGAETSFLKHGRIWTAVFDPVARSFAPPSLVSESADGFFPWLTHGAPEISDEEHLYLSWAGPRETDPNVYLSRSEDGARSWSEARRLNPWDEPRRKGPHTALAVDTAGRLGIAWLDSHGAAQERCTRLFFRATLPTSAALTPPIPVSAGQACSDDYYGDGGEYFGLATASPGRFHAVWVDNRGGTNELWAARIDLQD